MRYTLVSSGDGTYLYSCADTFSFFSFSWDPIAGKCLNSGFQDGTRPIGPNGANLTSSGSTNTGNLGDSSDSSDGFKKFGNGATPMRTYSDATLGRFAVAIAVLSLTVAFFV